MKKLITICLFCLVAIGYAQENKPTFKAEGDLVKATYYHEDGSVSTEGYFKDKKLTGKWTRFDKKGNKTHLAFYKEGKKVGKWFMWSGENLKEITYNNNAIVDVSLWKSESKLASNK
ncbi:toxin-antitoxin system YwqK family antitoxin [Polaribacter cellanae]|uniref:Nicotinic acid mononucleotide adenyltransferase n=1 Tax=Polaribacter cellanae TaxID=2818493 RepID=A0A975H5Q4_9FLAO|nr:nicotinic acid mononucleotide adenyltransferase [Polaribacter cellanae]QTE21632.1 nicotinic acid mononucleotide adenyltransferase [Polaribacter cellanae]